MDFIIGNPFWLTIIRLLAVTEKVLVLGNLFFFHN